MNSTANELWRRYLSDKTTDARNDLAEYYLPLVKLVAGRLNLPAHVDKDDLLSSGFFGLLDALERFDPSRAVKFETYAGVRIRGAMLDYLRAQDWLPVSQRQRVRKVAQMQETLACQLGREPTESELASALNISREELHTLNTTVPVPLEDYFPTATAAEPFEQFELRETLNAAIESLPAKERLVVTLYYFEELTLKEISLLMHLTEARISQLHTKAIKTIRNYEKQLGIMN